MVSPLVRVGVFAAAGGVVGFVTSVVLFLIVGLVTGRMGFNDRISSPAQPGARLVFQIVMLFGTIAGASLGGLLGRVRVRDPRKARVLAALIGAILGFLLGSCFERRPGLAPKGAVAGAVLLPLFEFGLTSSSRKPVPAPRHPLGDGDLER